jgi:predicted RNA-binding Zn-ribbon protein involved in translation (DUF1610 family)
MAEMRPERAARVEDDGEVRVRTRVVHERFRCAHCGNEWVATYEVRDYRSPAGARWVVHARDGRPVRGPHLGSRCPSCGRVSVPADRWSAGVPTEPAPEARA